MIWPEDILLAAKWADRQRQRVVHNDEEPGYIYLAPPLLSLADYLASPNGELVQGLDDS